MTATDVITPTTEVPVKVKTPAEVTEEATTYLVTGKRHLLVSDIPAAVSSLAQACELLSAHFGETAKECAESYFYYGKSLLELSRMESGVLGNALEGVPEEGDDANTSSKIEDPAKMTEDEKEEVEEIVGEAMEKNFQSLCESKDEENDMEESGDSQDEGMDEGVSVEGETKESKVTGESTEKMEDEEPSNLQLAWEMLELAKIVYTKQVESGEGIKIEVEERLCSTILTLGEVSIENENYSQAVEDIQLCIKKVKSLPKDSRIIAEAHYQLGVAQGFHAKFDEAVESLNSAISIIKERMKNIKAGAMEEMTEITELEALVPEIEEKIADTKDMKKEAEAKTKEGADGITSSSAKGDSKNVPSIAVKSKKFVANKEKTAAAS
eukprot:GFUD01022058.1.p1 GENE.GFUD01022058.1~~GFUD01022058.1.p1  ORF type:complete len:382 (+),score=135.60 GFUD01022058.1:114-1259(+)